MSETIEGAVEAATLAQHGMWLTERAGLGGTVYHMPLTIHFDGPLEADALLAACAVVVDRHPILTATFAERDGDLAVLYGSAKPPISLADAPPREQPFDLATGPLIRFTLVRHGAEEHVLHVVAHHIVFDGVSKDVLVADLAAAYGASPLTPPQPAPRPDLKLAQAAEFWRTRWHDDTPLLPGGNQVSLRSAPAESVELSLDALPTAAARLGVTRFEALTTALILILHGYGNERVGVAVDVSTRTPQDASAIGVFINELPLITTPSGTYGEAARAVHDELRAAYAFRRAPVARALGGVSPRTTLLPVSISYRARSTEAPEFPGVRARVDWAVFNGWVRGSLHLQAVESPTCITARLQINPDVISRADAQDLAERLRALLDADPATPITELPLPGKVTPRAVIEAAAPAADVDAGVLNEIVAIFGEVLEMDDVQPEDDLFDLGGHSLTITQIIARVRDRLNVDLSFEVFIDTPTPVGVAQEIERARRC